MNERIRELAEQAQGPRPRIHGEWTLTNAELEMFAESLIKETLDVARAGVEYGDGMESAVYRYFGLK